MTNEPETNERKTNEASVKELGHVVLYVRDLERSVRFYRDALGWRQIFSDASIGFPAAMFSGGRTHHELLLIEVGPDATPIPPGRRVGLYHFGLKVGDSDEELVAMLRRLEDAGVAVGGAADHGMTHSLYIADPDGNEIELYVDVPGADWNDPHVVMAPPKPLRI
jgi:catechol-2,3-dioxygenase